jgi:hypothetical protein
VALFNWEYLLLFHFDKLQPRDKGRSKTAGDQANVTWITEGKPEGSIMERAHIRMVLLGWILNAFHDAFA